MFGHITKSSFQCRCFLSRMPCGGYSKHYQKIEEYQIKTVKTIKVQLKGHWRDRALLDHTDEPMKSKERMLDHLGVKFLTDVPFLRVTGHNGVLYYKLTGEYCINSGNQWMFLLKVFPTEVSARVPEIESVSDSCLSTNKILEKVW